MYIRKKYLILIHFPTSDFILPYTKKKKGKVTPSEGSVSSHQLLLICVIPAAPAVCSGGSPHNSEQLTGSKVIRPCDSSPCLAVSRLERTDRRSSVGGQ